MTTHDYQILPYQDCEIAVEEKEPQQHDLVYSDGIIGKYFSKDSKFIYLMLNDGNTISRKIESCHKLFATTSKQMAIELGIPLFRMEDEVEKSIKNVFKKNGFSYDVAIPEFKNDLIDLYKSARQKYRFSESDIHKAIQFGFNQYSKQRYIDDTEKAEFILSLQPKKILRVGMEEVCFCGLPEEKSNGCNYAGCCSSTELKPLTTPKTGYVELSNYEII